MHDRSKRWALAALGGLLMTPAFGGPLRDAIVDRVLSRRIEAAQESGEFGEGKSEPLTLPSYVKAQLDVSYGADPAQRMDVYMPATRNGHAPMPVIFMVHGGAWMIGDKSTANVVMNKITRWIPKGYVVVCPNYRMLPKTDVQGEVDDVGKALAYAQAHAADWGGDASRFVLMGHSAGAHLVSLMSAAPELALNQGARPWLGTVSLDSASMDVVRTMQEKHYSFYDKVFGSDQGFWQQVSPYGRLRKAPAPMMLVCSTKRADSCPQARSFADKVNALGGKATVLPVDLTHADVNKKLGESSAYTDAVEAFLRSIGLN